MNMDICCIVEICVNIEFDCFERIYERAAWADSCIIAPIEPVIINCLEPFIIVASTYNTSPPNGVHARPVCHPLELTFFEKYHPDQGILVFQGNLAVPPA